MKQSLKNEIDVLALIHKIQEQLMMLDKKVDTLIHRSLPETKLNPRPSVNNTPSPAKSHDHNKGRLMYSAICADCKKECQIPFKPSGDRPVYCQDCFSRRKVISLSGISIAHKPNEAAALQSPVLKEVDISKTKDKIKKKAAPIKKPIAKKKSTSKRK